MEAVMDKVERIEEGKRALKILTDLEHTLSVELVSKLGDFYGVDMSDGATEFVKVLKQFGRQLAADIWELEHEKL
jgi:hypothetical protein